METGLLHNYFGNFLGHVVKDIITRSEIDTRWDWNEHLKTQKNQNFLFMWRGPLVMIFDRVGVGVGGGWQEFQMGGSLGPDQVGRGQLGARQRHQEPDRGRGTGCKMVGWSTGGWISDKGWGSRQEMGFQTWGWGSRQGMGFQTWGWGSRQRVGFQTRGVVLDMGYSSRHGWGSRHGVGFQTWGCGTRHRWSSRHGMMGCQTDDWVPGRGRITTFMSHQRGILHSLIF